MNKKAMLPRAISQSFNQQPGHARRDKPVAAQLKNLAPAHSSKMAIAPPAFRPLAAPNAAPANGAMNRKRAIAPSVDRPRSAAKVAQPKMANVSASRSTIQLVQCGECFQHNSHAKTCSKYGGQKVTGNKEQSLQDRNVNKYLAYQTPNKKTIEQDVAKVKTLKTTLAHGKGNSQSNQSGKTKNLLKDLK